MLVFAAQVVAPSTIPYPVAVPIDQGHVADRDDLKGDLNALH